MCDGSISLNELLHNELYIYYNEILQFKTVFQLLSLSRASNFVHVFHHTRVYLIIQ